MIEVNFILFIYGLIRLSNDKLNYIGRVKFTLKISYETIS